MDIRLLLLFHYNVEISILVFVCHINNSSLELYLETEVHPLWVCKEFPSSMQVCVWGNSQNFIFHVYFSTAVLPKDEPKVVQILLSYPLFAVTLSHVTKWTHTFHPVLILLYYIVLRCTTLWTLKHTIWDTDVFVLRKWITLIAFSQITYLKWFLMINQRVFLVL